MQTVLVNAKRCIGCRHCEIACSKAHADPVQEGWGPDWSALPRPRVQVLPGVNLLTFPLKCRHCDPAPCVGTCPSGALFRDPESDSVLFKAELCISCGMCAMVCPFGAVSFDINVASGRTVALKCDNCVDRQQQGKVPACVEACKTEALIFGDFNTMLDKEKTSLAQELTQACLGMPASDTPPNIELFQKIKTKLAGLGPLPSR